MITSSSNWRKERCGRIHDKAREQRLAITETTTDFVATVDIDGFFMYLNRAGRELLEIGDSEDISRVRMHSLYTRTNAGTNTESEISRAILLGASHSEQILRTRSGKSIPVSQVLIAHVDRGEVPSHFSMIVRDISDIREAEEKRQQVLRQMQQNRHMEILGRLAGGVAHDYNNLMTIIMGNAELGRSILTESGDCNMELEIIIDSARKAARLSSQLLDFCSKQMIEPQVLDLNEVLQNSLQLLKSMMSEEVTITLDCARDLWPVCMDLSQLEQVILNLSANARDAMSSHGSFRLLTGNAELDANEAAEAGLETGGMYVRLVVQDSGCGIDGDIIENIFDPFFTTKERGKGTGLGLSAVYGSIKQNKGSINVESVPGQGTTFTVYLPRSKAAAASHAPETHEDELAAQTVNSETIVLVEDDDSVRNLLSRILGNMGYQVLEAANGMDALDILTREPSCDLVISDMIMPVMNGMELLREMRKRNLRTRFIFMSGHNEDMIAHGGFTSGKIPLLKKPFPPKILAATIRNVLDVAPMSAPSPAR